MPRLPTRKATALFCYLALNHRRLCPRDELVRTLWPDHDEAVARKQLRNELWRIKDFFTRCQPDAGSPLALDRGWVRLAPSDQLWLDVAELESLVPRDNPDRVSLVGLERAVSLYRGELLAGLDEEWCYGPREHLRRLHLEVLERLFASYQESEAWSAAVATGQRLLAADPLLEHVEQQLLTCFGRLGDRPRAVREFATFAATLKREMALEPTPATVALLRSIATPALEAAQCLPGEVAPGTHPDLGEIASALDQLALSLEALREQVHRCLSGEAPDWRPKHRRIQ